VADLNWLKAGSIFCKPVMALVYGLVAPGMFVINAADQRGGLERKGRVGPGQNHILTGQLNVEPNGCGNRFSAKIVPSPRLPPVTVVPKSVLLEKSKVEYTLGL